MTDQAQATQDVEPELVLPDVRVGQVWEDCSSHVEAVSERKLRIVEVPVDAVADSKVAVENVVTRHASEIRLDRFVPGSGGFRRLA